MYANSQYISVMTPDVSPKEEAWMIKPQLMYFPFQTTLRVPPYLADSFRRLLLIRPRTKINHRSHVKKIKKKCSQYRIFLVWGRFVKSGSFKRGASCSFMCLVLKVSGNTTFSLFPGTDISPFCTLFNSEAPKLCLLLRRMKKPRNHFQKIPFPPPRHRLWTSLGLPWYVWTERGIMSPYHALSSYSWVLLEGS